MIDGNFIVALNAPDARGETGHLGAKTNLPDFATYRGVSRFPPNKRIPLVSIYAIPVDFAMVHFSAEIVSREILDVGPSAALFDLKAARNWAQPVCRRRRDSGRK